MKCIRFIPNPLRSVNWFGSWQLVSVAMEQSLRGDASGNSLEQGIHRHCRYGINNLLAAAERFKQSGRYRLITVVPNIGQQDFKVYF